MTSHRLKHLALAAMIPAALIITVPGASAQTPAPSPQSDAPPAKTDPAPAATPDTAKPAAGQAPAGAPAQPSAPAAEAGQAAPATPAPDKDKESAATDPAKDDAFAEPTELKAKTAVLFSGKAKWDAAFSTLVEALRSLGDVLDKQGVKASGNPYVVYTATDDTGFSFTAALPVDQPLKDLPKTMTMGKTPEGKALKFVHRGSYDNMDNTYEAITNHLDNHGLEAKDTFIEEYTTDPLKTAEDLLVINVFVPMK